MNWLRGIAVALVLSPVAFACSSGAPATPVGEAERVGQVSQAITTACGFDTLGLPCDPDGPAGPKLECEGVCNILVNGNVACQVAVAGSLNGVICGSASGVGDAACKRHCSGKTCLASNAPAGAACRPNNKSTPCEGQCDGAGKCDNLGGSACEFGRDGQLCQFATCNFANASQCLTKNLVHNAVCSDTDACTIGKCGVTGICNKGPVKGCDDGNSCTDDTCDAVDGGCLGTNNDANTCTDGNACFTGEHCSAGTCVAGTVPVDCEDDNACTTDSCDPNTGCAHVQKSCSDGDACTQDVCATDDGSCSHPPVTCTDGDPCTDDSCNAATGCVFAPKDCNDNNLCFADSCVAGACEHVAVSCDDQDDCTADSCSALTGCAHVAIVGCGGGTGGAGGAGDAVAGAPAEGGAPDGGGARGVAGEGPIVEAGQPSSTAGAGGVAGAVGVAGAAAGTANVAGATTGGGAGSSSGGLLAAGGDSIDTAGTSGSQKVVDDGGCGCRTAGTPTRGSAGALGLTLLGLTAAVRRRRRAA